MIGMLTSYEWQPSDMCLQDDTKVVLSKPEVITMVETVQKQQQQFSDLPEHIPLDPHIPITFTKVSLSYPLASIILTSLCKIFFMKLGLTGVDFVLS